jgi:hypothetical protein
MNLSMKVVVANTVYTLLVGVTVADVSLFSYMTALTHRNATDSTPFVRDVPDSAAGIRPRGYSDAGIEVAASSMSDKGWAVRYTSPGCKFCRADEPKWSALKSELVASGYQVYDLLPSSSKRPTVGHNDEMPIAFIDVGWMKQYRLTGTPTTLIFNRHGKIIWAHAGTMSDEDQKSALRTLFWNKSRETQ